MKAQIKYLPLILILLSCNSGNNKTEDNIAKNEVEKLVEQDGQSIWTETKKQELCAEINAEYLLIIDKYGELGQEFADIYVEKIMDRFTPTQAQSRSLTETAEIIDEALMATSPGWTDEAKNNFMKFCRQGMENSWGVAKTQEARKNVDTYCECVFEKLKLHYPNELIADVKSQGDTLVKYYGTKCMSAMIIDGMKELFKDE